MLAAAVESSEFSRPDIARAADVSTQTLANWTSGRVHPNVDLLTRVVKFLGLEISDVVVVDPATRMFSDLRVAAGLTQPQLATAAGLPTRTLQDIERGNTKQLKRRHVAALTGPLGVTADELLEAWTNTRKRPPKVSP